MWWGSIWSPLAIWAISSGWFAPSVARTANALTSSWVNSIGVCFRLRMFRVLVVY